MGFDGIDDSPRIALPSSKRSRMQAGRGEASWEEGRGNLPEAFPEWNGRNAAMGRGFEKASFPEISAGAMPHGGLIPKVRVTLKGRPTASAAAAAAAALQDTAVILPLEPLLRIDAPHDSSGGLDTTGGSSGSEAAGTKPASFPPAGRGVGRGSSHPLSLFVGSTAVPLPANSPEGGGLPREDLSSLNESFDRVRGSDTAVEVEVKLADAGPVLSETDRVYVTSDAGVSSPTRDGSNAAAEEPTAASATIHQPGGGGATMMGTVDATMMLQQPVLGEGGVEGSIGGEGMPSITAGGSGLLPPVEVLMGLSHPGTTPDPFQPLQPLPGNHIPHLSTAVKSEDRHTEKFPGHDDVKLGDDALFASGAAYAPASADSANAPPCIADLPPPLFKLHVSTR